MLKLRQRSWSALPMALILSLGILTQSAEANTDLTLSDKPMFLKVLLPNGMWRDVNVSIVEEVPGDRYAFAVGAENPAREAGSPPQSGSAVPMATGGPGTGSRCLVYIERRHLQYLWHELDHCRYESHTD